MNKKLFAVRGAGNSMLPLYPSGTIMLVKKRIERQVHIGDLVWVKWKNKSFVHRIIAKNEQYFLIKGDGERQADGWIDKKNIQGVATGYIKNKKVISLETTMAKTMNRFFAFISYTRL